MRNLIAKIKEYLENRKIQKSLGTYKVNGKRKVEVIK